MHLRDDDDIYRARLLYLGPTDWTLPVHLPYAEWGLFAAIAAVLGVLVFLATGELVNVFATTAAAMVATSLIWRYVDPDRPARVVIRTALTDWQAITPPADGDRLPGVSTRHITIHHEITKG